MSYHLDFSDQTKSDIDFHKKSGNKAVLKKIFTLLFSFIDLIFLMNFIKFNVFNKRIKTPN